MWLSKEWESWAAGMYGATFLCFGTSSILPTWHWVLWLCSSTGEAFIEKATNWDIVQNLASKDLCLKPNSRQQVNIAKGTTDPKFEYFFQSNCSNKSGTSWHFDKLLPSCQLSTSYITTTLPQHKDQQQCQKGLSWLSQQSESNQSRLNNRRQFNC